MNIAAFGITYLLLALFSVSLPRFEPLHAWPAHGIALGVLLLVPARRWPPYLAIILAATLAAGLFDGAPAGELAALAAIALLLPAATALGLARLAGPTVQVDSIRGLAAFLVGIVAVVIVTALFEAGYAAMARGAAFRPHWTIAFVSAVLGMMLLAPL